MYTLEASKFKRLPNQVQEILLQSNTVPVNDIFLPIWDSKVEIILLLGSYGSGKSVYAVDRAIDHCLTDPYFRCYFGRKVLGDVRGSIFQTIIDRIRELKKDHLFDFSDKPNSSMNIVHRTTGNMFLPFGASDAKSLKSIKDPTHMLCEELDQFTFEDFGLIYSRLRTEKADTQLYGIFNTEKVYQSHWIRKVFWDGEYKDQSLKLKANYYDNHFIDQEAYLKKLQLIANGNIAILNSIAHGEWGFVRTGNEFWKQFSEVKHVKPVQYDPSTTIHVSLDENVIPYVTATIWQVFPLTKEIKQVQEILSRTPDNNAPKGAKKFIKWLKDIGYQNTVFVYGDPSGQSRSTVDENNASFFEKYLKELQDAGFKFQSRVGKSAPEVSLSADFVNDIYEKNLNGWSITISDRCFESIEDYILVKQDDDGTMLKPTVKDKETGGTYQPQGHISDTKRYFIIQLLQKEWLLYKQRIKPRPVGGFFH